MGFLGFFALISVSEESLLDSVNFFGGVELKWSFFMKIFLISFFIMWTPVYQCASWDVKMSIIYTKVSNWNITLLYLLHFIIINQIHVMVVSVVHFFLYIYIIRRLHAAQSGVSDWMQFSGESAGFRSVQGHSHRFHLPKERSFRWGQDCRGAKDFKLWKLLFCLVIHRSEYGPESECTPQDSWRHFRQSLLLVSSAAFRAGYKALLKV